MSTQMERSSKQRKFFISNKPAGVKDIPEGKCTCSVCGIEKTNNDFYFYNYRDTADGNRLRTNTNCKSCLAEKARQRRKARKHAPPKPAPGTPCACCGKPTEKHEFDHDHKTGQFRGWVCKACNVGLGKFGDEAAGLVDPVIYLYNRSNKEQKRAFIEKLTESVVD